MWMGCGVGVYMCGCVGVVWVSHAAGNTLPTPSSPPPPPRQNRFLLFLTEGLYQNHTQRKRECDIARTDMKTEFVCLLNPHVKKKPLPLPAQAVRKGILKQAQRTSTKYARLQKTILDQAVTDNGLQHTHRRGRRTYYLPRVVVSNLTDCF
ncbi:hypothetical protein QBC38DRAFT_160273 [Podospora fimiseda]|uniref:Secreted protein n=1 Tax=Podospora fimiseda TaxID=252190 RepID=A0AAN7BSP0_9PEZI|nr:hypothetical protein QBC38DRAFT_160273 [Podospora fimiseda]